MVSPHPSPDGQTLAVIGDGKIAESSGLIDLMAPLPQRSIRYLPLFDEARGFGPVAWSPEGKRLVGSLRTATTSEDGVVVYSLETRKYERVSSRGYPVAWLPDGRRVLCRDKNILMAVDVETKKTQPVLDKLGVGVGSLVLAHDGRTILAARYDIQADVGMLGAPDPTSSTSSDR